MLALEFPPINEILRWRDLFPTFNKVALIAVAASLISIVIFLLAARRDAMKAPMPPVGEAWHERMLRFAKGRLGPAALAAALPRPRA